MRKKVHAGALCALSGFLTAACLIALLLSFPGGEGLDTTGHHFKYYLVTCTRGSNTMSMEAQGLLLISSCEDIMYVCRRK